MSYQDQVGQLKDAGFSGQDIQNWSDNQAVQLRQGGFSQDEVDSYQGMKGPPPGQPPVYGRLPTDDDFKNAASVILKGNDHPFYEKAIDSLRGLFSDTGVEPAQAVKASQEIPSFRAIMENGGEAPSWGDYGSKFIHGAGSTVASGMQGLSELHAYLNPDDPGVPLSEQGANPETTQMYQRGVAFQQWIDKKYSSNPETEKNNPIKMGLAGGLGSLVPLIATGGAGMVATGAGGAYQEAKQAGAPIEKATEYATKMGGIWGALGIADVGVFLKPIARSAPGLIPWITVKATQALRSGATFAGTNELGDWLSSEIAQAADIPIQYKPIAQQIVVNAILGAVAGVFGHTSVKRGETAIEKPSAEQPVVTEGQPPSPSAPAAQLTPAYHFDTDSYGLKNEKGEFVQTGFPTEHDARTTAEQAPAPTFPPQQRLEPEVIDRYKKTIADEAEKIGIPLTPEQLQAAATKMAESHNPVVEAKKPEVTPAEPAYTTIPRKPLGLADFVRQAGGVNDEGGDVRSILGGARFRPGLVNGEGKSIDDMALAAHEAGYFTGDRPSTNDFLDKLSDDLHGKPQHSEHDFDKAQAYNDALRYNQEVDRVSTETGVQAEGKTHTQFWDEVTKYYSRDQVAEKRADFGQRAQEAYESWRTEALEPEERMTKEDLEHERTQDNIAKDQKSIAKSPGEAGSAAEYTREGEEIGGLGGRGAEPARSAGPAETAETVASTAVRAEPSERGGDGRGPSLPKQLAGAKPRYGYGDKQFTLSFENDIDKALYITSQKTPSKRDADYREFLKENGLTDAQIQSEGQKVRAEIKRSVQDHPEFEDDKKVSNLHIPDQSHAEEFIYHKGLNRGILSSKRISSPELRALTDFVEKVAPQSRFKVHEGNLSEEDGQFVHGYYDPTEDLITLSTMAPDKWSTTAHESLHSIVHLLTDSEYKALVEEGRNRGLMEKYDIEKNYSDRPDMHEEEMIAHWFGDYISDKRTQSSKEVKNLFQKVMDILSQISSKVREIFGDTSTEDIFKKIESGEVGSRTGERLSKEGKLFDKKDYRQEKLWPEPKNDVAKDEKEEKPTISDAIRGIRDTFSPTSAGDLAKREEVSIRGAYGEAKRERAIAETALNEFARQANKMTPDQHADFYNYVEGRSKGAQLQNKQFQAMADTVRDIYGHYKDLIQAMPEMRMMHFVTDYFTHQWADGQEEKIKDFMNTWWQQGSGRNLKERKIPTIADGLAYGLKLAEPNPVRAVSRYAGSMSNYLASVKVLRAINNDLGGGYYADGLQPQGYAPLVGRNAERIENARIDPASGKIIPARNLKLYAPKQVADLYNAFYSKGFEDTRLKPAYMLARDAINTNTLMELGLSAYHASTITMQSLNQDMGRILRNAFAGDWQGVGDAIKGLVTPGLHFYEGQKVMEKYKEPGKNYSIADTRLGGIYEGLSNHGIDIDRIADEFAKSNLRIGLDPLSNVSTHGGFYKAWQRGELPQVMERLKSQMTDGHGIGALKSGAEAVSRVVSDVSHPLFNVYIPAIKMSAFHDLMGDWLRQNKGATDSEIAQARVRIGDMVEDRFGEMNMENLFWNKKAKELMGLSLRAPGWDLGLVRQVGGAGYDIYRMIKDGISRNGFDANRLDRPLFMAGSVIVYAAINSAMTYIKTGQLPSDMDLMDFIAYKTGGLHKAFGTHPERAELPGHGRELIQMAPIPGKGPLSGIEQEVGNKVATLPKKIYEAGTNTDWNGKPIYDPKSKNWYQRIPGVAQAVHIASGFEPFSMEQLFGGAPEGSKLSLAERFMGVRAAGAKIVNPQGLKEFNQRKTH